ncbi:hypothetical protein [Moorena producens]|uniref:hypothetical protein n=1 Tax=Moorena producens TaxID=1155739 RepID=UPI003C771FA0
MTGKVGIAQSRCYVVAQLVEHPIEIVEYQLKARVCHHCGTLVGGELPENIIPGQDKKRQLAGHAGTCWDTTVICLIKSNKNGCESLATLR